MGTKTVGFIKYSESPLIYNTIDRRGVLSEALSFRNIIQDVCNLNDYHFIDLNESFKRFLNKEKQSESSSDKYIDNINLSVLFILNGPTLNKESSDNVKKAIEFYRSLFDRASVVYYIQIDPALYLDVNNYPNIVRKNNVHIIGNTGIKAALTKTNKCFTEPSFLKYYSFFNKYVQRLSQDETSNSFITNCAQTFYSDNNSGSKYYEFPLSCYRFNRCSSQIPENTVPDPAESDEQVDLIYIGGSRNGMRDSIIKKYCCSTNKNFKVAFCGFFPDILDEFENSENISFYVPVKFNEVPSYIRVNSKSTVLIGDPIYSKLNIIAPRYIEALESERICFISEEMMSEDLTDELKYILSKKTNYSDNEIEEVLQYIKVTGISNIEKKIDQLFNFKTTDNVVNARLVNLKDRIICCQNVILNYLMTVQLNVLYSGFQHLINIATYEL